MLPDRVSNPGRNFIDNGSTPDVLLGGLEAHEAPMNIWGF